MHHLFRAEALAHHRIGLLGSVRMTTPKLGWYFAGLALAVIIVSVLLVCFGRYIRHEHASGRLVADGGLAELSAGASGIVEAIAVREGDKVNTGQVLMQISGGQQSAALGDTETAAIRGLNEKRTRLQSDRESLVRLDGLQISHAGDKIAAMHSARHILDEQVALERERTSAAQKLEEQWKKAGDSGVVSRLQMLQQHDIALEHQARLKDLTRQGIDTDGQLADLRGRLEQSREEFMLKRNEIDAQLLDVELNIGEREVRRRAIVRATLDGVVVNVTVFPGQSVIAQQHLLTIVPKNSILQAELWLPSKAIGFVQKDMSVLIRYDAFPFQRFGQHLGKVREIGGAAALLPRTGEPSPPLYRVLIDLDSQSVPGVAGTRPLRPGMSFDADLLIEDRRIIDWLVEPLLAAHK